MKKSNSPRKKVVVTGFGVFRNYDVNPSWEAVKLLSIPGVELVKCQIPVEYDIVDETVPKLWQEHQPDLMIHCGVSHLAEGLVLEKVGHGHDYDKKDVKGCLPKCSNICSTTDNSNSPSSKLTTQINVDVVCDQVNRSFEGGKIKLPSATSSNAGRYLCEYTFHKSLCHSSDRTVFIHVPEVTKFSIEETAAALEETITCLLRIIDGSGENGECGVSEEQKLVG